MNRYRDSLIILAEDEALHAVVNGYLIHGFVNQRACKLERYERGWRHVEDRIPGYVQKLQTYPKLRVLFVIDFDKDTSRFQRFRDAFANAHDRMFVLGPQTNVEDLRKCLGAVSPEGIGEQLAAACPAVAADGSPWQCEQLKHVLTEVERLQQSVGAFLHK